MIITYEQSGTRPLFVCKKILSTISDSLGASPTLPWSRCRGTHVGKRGVWGVVHYESRKRELKKRRKNGYRCDERLKTKVEESTCPTYTGLYEELEHLKYKDEVNKRESDECDGWVLLFIIRVKWELKRVYRNRCRYNERPNTERLKQEDLKRLAWTGLCG